MNTAKSLLSVGLALAASGLVSCSIPKPECTALYNKYKKLADATPGVHFVGRLATYKYYNMDQIVAQALTTYGKIAGMKRVEAAAHAHGNGNGSGYSKIIRVSTAEMRA